MKRVSWLVAAVGLVLTSGCLDNQAQQQVLLELDKVNERLNNINMRFDRLQKEAQTLKQQVEAQQATVAELYRAMQSMRSDLNALERRADAHPGQPPPPQTAAEDEDIRLDAGPQQSVGQFLQQMKAR
ncbi:MAG: hypothetical protein ABR497_09415 [Kiritimatiellia bacterium]